MKKPGMPLETSYVVTTPENASRPEVWLRTARVLRRAADLLWRSVREAFEVSRGPAAQPGVRRRYLPDPTAAEEAQMRLELLSVVMMLAGFALENLAKGMIIGRETKRVTPAGIERWHKGHDLVALFARAEFALTAEETDLARRMTAHVVWGGRYPVPMKFTPTAERHWKHTDYDVFSELFDRVAAQWDTGKET